ncbi:hypothetical protein [Klebsiella oxytoca]|uniref:hypothetical protein n=1 Tax=Klebsiella oxytoca TaxID=571 RepID=UPI001CC97A73|nr:hypothetical protein [Klebsiella oxytoca]
MVGLQNWHFKELLSAAKSKKEYKMLFSRPEGKVVSRLGVSISRIARFCPVFRRIIRFYPLLYLYFRKGLPKIFDSFQRQFSGASENISAGIPGHCSTEQIQMDELFLIRRSFSFQ